MDVCLHKPRHQDPVAPVNHLIECQTKVGRCRGLDRYDPSTINRHAAGEDSIRRVERDNGSVFDEQVIGHSHSLQRN
jgi:hypothetical protein